MLSIRMTGYLGMDLPRFLAMVRGRRWLILGIVVAATVLALVWSLTQPNRYDASADLLFGRTTTADSVITGGATDTTDVPERTAATNLALASLDSVAANVKRRFPGPVTAQQLKDAVAVEAWKVPARAVLYHQGRALIYIHRTDSKEGAKGKLTLFSRIEVEVLGRKKEKDREFIIFTSQDFRLAKGDLVVTYNLDKLLSEEFRSDVDID